jgi:3-deoxy-D-manno-octulosonate 8-phosphate phosphatase (KDO 8-P phosphatase)
MSMLFKNIEVIIFDFDGVLTDNKVHINENGIESVTCSRSDGLAFDVLRKLKKPAYILSTENNIVIQARAKKIKIPAIQGVKNKVEAITKLAATNGYSLKNIAYVGNDLNDYLAMKSCGFSACPKDSHSKIKKISSVVLNTNGGDGVVRELLEDVFELDFIKILY